MKIDRSSFSKLPVDEKLLVLFDSHEDLSKCMCGIEAMVKKGGHAGDPGAADSKKQKSECLYIAVGDAKLKIPVAKSTIKALGFGSFILLLFTGQININSPLAQEIVSLLARAMGF